MVRVLGRLALCFSVLGVLHGSQASQQERYRFGVEVRNVHVDVFVTRDGKPVSDLTRRNFVILDNGVPQEIDLVDVDSVPMSAMLVLDISGSVRGQRLNHLRTAARAFVEGLDEEDEAGLLMFAERLRLGHAIDSEFETLNEALGERFEGVFTALNDALFSALTLLDEAKGRPLLLLFTDGMDNTSWLRDSDVLEVAGASETVVFAVGVHSRGGVQLYGGNRRLRGSNPEEAGFLERLTRSTGGQVWYVDKTEDLTDVYLRILAEMDTRYLLTYEPQGVSEGGWHEIEVKLKGSKASGIRARSGYYAPPNR